MAAFMPLTEIVKLVNIGTLFAFVLVNIGVIILRRTRPDLKRGFRVPFVPVFPIIGAGLCIYLMMYLDGETWLRFVVWLAHRSRRSTSSTAAATRGCARARCGNPEAELPRRGARLSAPLSAGSTRR